MAASFSYYDVITTPSNFNFQVWGRNSQVHLDLSVDGVTQADKESEDGLKYDGHLVHPADRDACLAAWLKACSDIAAGNNLDF